MEPLKTVFQWLKAAFGWLKRAFKWLKNLADRVLKSVLAWLKKHELTVYGVTALAGTYLAGANVLRAAKVPSEHAWAPWSGLFIALLACAIYVPIYALYKSLDAHYEAQDRAQAESQERALVLDRNLEACCQQLVSLIARQCPNVEINQIAASVWLCRDDNQFDPRARFFLPRKRRSSGVNWRRGKGVAGVAWAKNEDVAVDLGPLQRRRRALGRRRFRAVPAAERYGMTYREVADTDVYSGIVALRLRSTDAEPKIVGMLVVDDMGSQDFDCVAQVTLGQEATTLIGECEELITDYV
jgi:hypothetical protein